MHGCETPAFLGLSPLQINRSTERRGTKTEEAAHGVFGAAYRGIKNAGLAVGRATVALAKGVLNTARKMILFIRRHKMVFFTYAISLALMIAMSATAGQIAAAIIPGFVWTLANVKGEMLPEDLLIEGKRPLSDTARWIPQNTQEIVGSKALAKRVALINRVENLVQLKGELGWVLLHGAPRIGKSIIAEEILKKAEANGQAVYRLSQEIYDQDSKNPYLTVAETLSRLGKASNKPPILFIDEFGRISQKLFRAIYEHRVDCNILAVQSDLKDETFQELEFYERFEKVKVPHLDVEGCIATLEKSYEPKNLISNGDITLLVKEIARRLGEFGKKKLLYESIKAIERACSIAGSATPDALTRSLECIKLFKKNFVELMPRVQEEEYEIFAERQKIVNNTVERLSRGWAYLCAPEDNHAEQCMKDVLYKVQEKGHPIYRINKFYFKEKNKFLSVNHMLETMAKTLTTAAKYSKKTPIFYIDNRMSASPADIFKKTFKDIPVHVFVFDHRTHPNSTLTPLFAEFIRNLPLLDVTSVENFLKNKYQRSLSNEELGKVFALVKAKLDTEEKQKAFYSRTEEILKTIERLSLNDIEEYIHSLDW